MSATETALADALADIAGIIPRNDGLGVWVGAECSQFNGRTCHQDYPADTGEWCPVCVAEVAWSAWKMGVLG